MPKTKNLLKRWSFPLIGILLAPAVLALFLATGQVLHRIIPHWKLFLPFLYGGASYIGIHLLFQKPLTVYVFGHELTHALAAFLSGIRVKSFSVSSSSGAVTLSDTNWFIALSPYCVPVYTFLFMLLFKLIGLWGPVPHRDFIFAFGIGFTLVFHAFLTVHALSFRQTDLEYAGIFFSLTVIAGINCLILILLLKAISPTGVSLRFFLHRLVKDSVLLYSQILNTLYWCAQRGWDFARAGAKGG
ncbi:MAG TPA: hypothetical protein PK876_03855 [Elusimicrobiota bacterium]|nr:hypothetical protein [Elusimicrobiota bacterium]